jgi:hypothetical protein
MIYLTEVDILYLDIYNKTKDINPYIHTNASHYIIGKTIFTTYRPVSTMVRWGLRNMIKVHLEKQGESK